MKNNNTVSFPLIGKHTFGDIGKELVSLDLSLGSFEIEIAKFLEMDKGDFLEFEMENSCRVKLSLGQEVIGEAEFSIIDKKVKLKILNLNY